MPQGWGRGVEEAEELRLVDDCGVAVRGHVAAEVKEEAVGGDEAKGHAHAPRRLGEAQDARHDEIAAGDGLKRVAEERDAREVEGEQFALRHHAEGPEAGDAREDMPPVAPPRAAVHLQALRERKGERRAGHEDEERHDHVVGG